MNAMMPVLTVRRVGRRFRVLARNQRANTAVEFALAAPAIFLFMFGIIEFGYALWVQNALDYSTAAAARCASLNGSACSGNVTSYAAGESGASLDAADFSYACRSGSTDSCASKTVTCGCQVTGNHTIALHIPWENALSVNLSSRACIAPPPKTNCAS
jgi:Flp pilus assembly protein TadG